MRIDHVQRRGFTLIELLVVIALIGILAGIVTASLVPARAKGRDDQRRANLASVANALQNYYSQQKQYPPQNGWASIDTIPGLVPAYLSQLPSDPKFPKPYSFTGGGYVYSTNGTTIDGQTKRAGSFFALDVTLERPTVADPLDSQIEPLDTSKSSFFRTGYYQYPAGGQIHYRISSR